MYNADGTFEELTCDCCIAYNTLLDKEYDTFALLRLRLEENEMRVPLVRRADRIGSFLVFVCSHPYTSKRTSFSLIICIRFSFLTERLLFLLYPFYLISFSPFQQWREGLSPKWLEGNAHSGISFRSIVIKCFLQPILLETSSAVVFAMDRTQAPLMDVALVWFAYFEVELNGCWNVPRNWWWSSRREQNLSIWPRLMSKRTSGSMIGCHQRAVVVRVSGSNFAMNREWSSPTSYLHSSAVGKFTRSIIKGWNHWLNKENNYSELTTNNAVRRSLVAKANQHSFRVTHLEIEK